MQTATDVPGEANEEPAPAKGFLINRNFALLAIGQAISNIGDFFYSTTLLVWVFALTHSAGAVSGVLIAQYVPIFLLGPIAGVFVDRWNRRQTMVVTDLARLVATLLPFVVPAPLRLAAIYLSVFLISTFSRFFMPAKSGLLQVIVPGKQQPQAASISQATFALSIIVGPAIAAPLYFVVGPLVSSIINAVSFLVSALTIRAIQASREALHPYMKASASLATRGVGLVMSELLAGFRFVARSKTLLMITFLILIAMLGAGAINALDIIFVSKNLHASTALYGPLAAASGAGTLIGAICAGFAIRRIKPQYMLTGSVILTGAGIFIYSLQTSYLAALVVIFISSIPQGGIDVGYAPLLLNMTPRTMMGRVQSVIETTMYGTSLVSIGLAGYFGQIVPVNVIFALGGILIAAGGIFGWFALPGSDKAQTQAQI